MAKLIPTIDPSEIENPGERKIAIALIEQLPSKVEVFHSFQWISLKAHKIGRKEKLKFQQGECDFVVLNPEFGILFIEVKGGSLKYNPEKYQWFRENKGKLTTLNKDPVDQVRNNMYALLKHVKREYQQPLQKKVDEVKLPFTCGYAVAFPDSIIQGKLPPNMHGDMLIDANKCNDIRATVNKAFERYKDIRDQPLSGKDVDLVHSALMSQYNLFPVLWRKVEDWELRIKRLTEEQQKILKFLSKQKKAAIEGIAGSGKTILALAKAQSLAKQGYRTLLLCYNHMLKQWFERAMHEDFNELVTIDTYHGLANKISKKVFGELLTDQNKKLDDQFWSEEAPEKLMQATDILDESEKFDAIVVDEGQDFNELWWASLQGMFKNPNNMEAYYVFFDPNQNIFNLEPTIPSDFQLYTLEDNCRNTVKIAEHCAGIIGKDYGVIDNAPIGEKPKIIKLKSIEEAFLKGFEEIGHWCSFAKGGLNWKQVVMFAPDKCINNWPKNIKNIPVTKDFDSWRDGKGVLITTWGKFKGLEADAIVIIESPDHQDNLTNANLYVSRSRAKYVLTVFQVESQKI